MDEGGDSGVLYKYNIQELIESIIVFITGLLIESRGGGFF